MENKIVFKMRVVELAKNRRVVSVLLNDLPQQQKYSMIDPKESK